MTLKEQLNEICINPNTGRLNSSRMGLPFFQKNYPSLVELVLSETSFYSDEEINFTKRIMLILGGFDKRLECGTCNGEVDPMARGEDKEHPFKRYCCQVCSGKANKGMKIIRSEEHQAEINAKREATMTEKYGVAYNTQREDMKEVFREKKYTTHSHINYALLEDKEQLSQMYSVMTSTEIGEIVNCDGSVVVDYLHKHEIPVGNTHTKLSSQQRSIGSYIESLGFVISYNEKIPNGKHDIDVLVPEKNFGVEYNGFPFHMEGFSPSRGKHYHQGKTIQCLENGIQLMHVFAPDFVERPDVVYANIQRALGKSKIVSRSELSVKILKKDIALDFISKNSLSKETRTTYCIGLYLGAELVFVLTILTPKTDKIKYIIQNVTHKNGLCVDGAIELCMHLISNSLCSAGDILYGYSDRTVSEGKDFMDAGFTFRMASEAEHRYISREGAKFVVHSKGKFTRHNVMNLPIYDPELGEWENMQANGFDRYWDSGLNVFRYIVQ